MPAAMNCSNIQRSSTPGKPGRVGAYQIQAAIAACHDEAARAADTDWPQILALYGLLQRMSDNPMLTLNRAVAVAMAVLREQYDRHYEGRLIEALERLVSADPALYDDSSVAASVS